MQQSYLTFSIFLIVFILSGCSPVFEEQFPDVYEKYRSEPTNKLATALTNNSGYANGYSSEKETVQ